MGPVTFTALLAALLMGAANVDSQRRVIGREPPSTDGWRPVAGSTEPPRYSTQAVGHPVLDRLRAHLEDAERRKAATTPTPSVIASFSAVGPRRDQNAGFSGRLVPPPRDQPPPATFPQDGPRASAGASHDLSPASQTHPGPYYLHTLLPPPRASDFLLEGPGTSAGTGATSYLSFPPFSGDYFSGAKQQPAAAQIQFFPQQPQAQAQQDVFGSLPQRQPYYQQTQQYQQPQQQQQQQQYQQLYQQQQPQQADYLLSTQHRQHPSAVSSQYTSHQAISAASPGVGSGQATSVFGGRDPVSATARPATTHTATAGAGAGSVTFHGNIRDQAAFLTASSLAPQGHRFETKRPTAASLGSFSPAPATTTVSQYQQPLFQQQAYTPSYAEIPAHSSAGVVGYTLGVSADEGAAAGSQVETPAQRGQHFLQQQANSLQRPEGGSASEKPGRKRRPSAAQKKPSQAEAGAVAQDARRPQPPLRQPDTYVPQQQFQPEAQHNTPVSWPPTAPQQHAPTAPEAPHRQEMSSGQRHGGRRRPPQPEASTHRPVQSQEEPGQLTTPRQHARRPPHRQHFAPSAQGPTSTPQLEQPTTGSEYRPHRRRRPTRPQERPAATAPGEQFIAPQQQAAVQQTYHQTTSNENAPTAPGAVGVIPSAPTAAASPDPPRRRPQKQKYHITAPGEQFTAQQQQPAVQHTYYQTPSNAPTAPGAVGEIPSAPASPDPPRRRPQKQKYHITAPSEQFTVPQQQTAVQQTYQQAPSNENTPTTPQHEAAVQQTYYHTPSNENAPTAPGTVGEIPSAPASPDPPRRRPQKQKYHITMDNDKRTVSSSDWEQTQNTVKPVPPHTRRPVQKQNVATEENATGGQPAAQEGRVQHRRRPARPQHWNPPATSLDSENYPQTQRDEESYTNVPTRPEEPASEASPIPERPQNQEVEEQQVFTRRPSTRYSTTESVTEAQSQDDEQPGQRTRVRQQHISRRPSPQKELTAVVHYRRPVHPSRRPQYKKGSRPTRPPPQHESEPADQQDTTNDPVSQSDNSGDYVQDYRLAESKKVQRQRYKRPQNVAEEEPVRTVAVPDTAYQLQSSSTLDAEDNYALDQQTAAAPTQKYRQRVNQQGLTRGKTKYHKEPLSETDTTLAESTEQVYAESPLQTEPDFENDVLGGGGDARFPSAVDYGTEEEDSASDVSAPPATTTTTSTTTSTTTTTTTTPAPATTRPTSTVPSALEKLRQRSRYNATRPRFSVRDFQERPSRLSTSTAAPDTSAPETTEAAVSRHPGRTRPTTTTPAAPAEAEAARPRPAARDPARVNSARYRASSTTAAATPSTRYKYKSRYRSTLSTSTTTEDPTAAATPAVTPTPSALVSRPSLRTKGIFSAVRPNPLLRMASSLGTTSTTTTTTTTTTSTTTPAAPTTVQFSDEADETPSAPSAPSAPGVFGVRTAEPPASEDDELSQSRRIAELTLARLPSSAPTTQPPQHTTDFLAAYWASQDSPAPPAASAPAFPATAADQSSTSHQWADDTVPPTQRIADLTSSASASDFFHKSMTSEHSLRITMATDDPILPLEAFFPSWGGKEDNSRR